MTNPEIKEITDEDGHEYLMVETGRNQKVTDEETKNAEKNEEEMALRAKSNENRRSKENEETVLEVLEITSLALMRVQPDRSVRRSSPQAMISDGEGGWMTASSENIRSKIEAGQISHEDNDSILSQGEAYNDTREELESVVWDALDSLKKEHIFSEIVDKMAYIEGQPHNTEAQLRGLFFEAISHQISPDDPRILATHGPETQDEDSPVNRRKTQDAIAEMRTMPIEEYKVVSSSDKQIHLEKGVILGDLVKKDLKELLTDERIKDVATLVDADQLRGMTTQLPDNAVYVYLPKLDNDRGSQLIRQCSERGVPYYSFDVKKGWQLNLPKKWHDRYSDEESKVKRARDLLAFEFFIRKKNQQHNQDFTTPDGIVVNSDGVPTGFVETKCWTSDEIDDAIVRLEKTQGITAVDVIKRTEMTLDQLIDEESAKAMEKRRVAISQDERNNLRRMNLAIKLAEELEYMGAAGVKMKGEKVILRFPADINPRQADEMVAGLGEKGMEVYVQILPVTTEQTGSLATRLLRSEIMLKKLEQRYAEKVKGGIRLEKIRVLKARCLALGTTFEQIKKMDKAPEGESEYIIRLWNDVKEFDKNGDDNRVKQHKNKKSTRR